MHLLRGCIHQRCRMDPLEDMHSRHHQRIPQPGNCPHRCINHCRRTSCHRVRAVKSKDRFQDHMYLLIDMLKLQNTVLEYPTDRRLPDTHHLKCTRHRHRMRHHRPLEYSRMSLWRSRMLRPPCIGSLRDN